ncbi:hypothetical protein ACFQ3P_04635 [Paraburkholderia sabiae]|uniref:Uncharacterized protein n=1 Tax=Paraburkholderia sabiae TaxID=273251 RepID=A0ABU9QNP9_9BURK|nr:hypothetical protein [Paraburkholderia sabiae]WJZ79150.1 hypothetical protein QEN71_34840 [Paraburkholderia sabiae]CAD6514473.1 hypothetical protein LMG24235_00927 [Paraburkholderia sabiae]
MARRAKLADHLIQAWRRTVQTDYCNGHINSERSLQALLVANLRAAFEEARSARRIFVEPTVQLPKGRLIRPDVVICNAREAICFLELKYVPRGRPCTAKDMQSISSIARAEGITVKLDRYRGPDLPSMSFNVSKTALFAWAAIHSGDTVPSGMWTTEPAFNGHVFLEMHAATIHGQNPSEQYHTNAGRVKYSESVAA